MPGKVREILNAQSISSVNQQLGLVCMSVSLYKSAACLEKILVAMHAGWCCRLSMGGRAASLYFQDLAADLEICAALQTSGETGGEGAAVSHISQSA